MSSLIFKAPNAPLKPLTSSLELLRPKRRKPPKMRLSKMLDQVWTQKKPGEIEIELLTVVKKE
jgi:hypothetical protein